MSIESEFKKFVAIAERIAVALENPVAVPVRIPPTTVDLNDLVVPTVVGEPISKIVTEEENIDEEVFPTGVVDETNEEICERDNSEIADDGITYDGADDVAVRAFVDSGHPTPLKITAADVKKEARALVDGFPEDRKGFEKAKKILKKLGAKELTELVPEKYADAVNAFRKAVKAWS